MVRYFVERDWLVHKIHDKHLAEAAENHARGRLLDVGCGEKPYEEMFKNFVAEHIGLDREDTCSDPLHVDVFGRAEDLPFEDEAFDTVLCSQVLEHIEEPNAAIGEIRRVLKKEGVLILTVPFVFGIHDEHDFHRFTRQGLRLLMEKSGFQIIELQALAGIWVSFAVMLVYWLWYRKQTVVLGKIAILLATLVQGLAYYLNKIKKRSPSGSWTWNYLVVARKAF